MSSSSISTEIITNKIFIIRGQKVMLDRDLAELYGVDTKQLKRAVKRNIARFPEDFMFELTQQEDNTLRYQFGTLKRGEHTKYLPYVFTEQGVAMLSSVLRSTRAVQVNIAIMRAFVRLRDMLSLHKELAVKLKELERKVEGNTGAIRDIFKVLEWLRKEEEKPKGKIGFHP
ncbi:MAG TPA: ORF6N domain-containing protein [Candidatus Omnitrophota bacterium]|nr:ORF6N domain-containing protein [Candidatus Omnitrophota bacterium]